MKDLTAIVAASASQRGIGIDGNLPWRLKADMEFFKKTTIGNSNNAVIMGRKTWESIPSKFRPLPNRVNVILTTQPEQLVKTVPDNVLVANSIENAVSQLETKATVDEIFIIGGSQVYQTCMEKGYVNKILYTKVSNLPETTKFDAFFPPLNPLEWNLQQTDEIHPDKENGDQQNQPMIDTNSGLSYQFLTYTRNGEELQYLDLCRSIIDQGVRRGDRTGTGTLSLFGAQMRFSLRHNRLPLLTTKRTFWRGVAEELLWFISGDTNAKNLSDKDIHIWDGNGSREFLDSRGLEDREEGDLGPVYGFQWRHFGAPYKTMHDDYTNQGVDQLANCIEKIKNNPEDRRIIMSAWNPADLDQMALPPCHMFCQFYVDTAKNELSCQMYQRSADMGLGVPFNIASYSLLTCLMAQVTGRKPGDFVHVIGDAHVYLNHVEALKTQLERCPREFPTLKINPEKTNIDDFVYEDFEVIGYRPHKKIQMKMAV